MGWLIYSGDIDRLEGNKPIGDGDCVDLVQKLASAGPTKMWMRGPRVVDMAFLNPGTVIANFVQDEHGGWKFPNKHGYHAAFFVEFIGRYVSGKQSGIRVMDQFVTRKPNNEVRARPIYARSHERMSNGRPYADCDDADAYYVVHIL